jgi:cell wall assembly regulator SMI1
MKEVWSRIENWIRANSPQVLEVLQPGASDAEIQALEAFLSIQFPDDVKNLYRLCNGQSKYGFGVLNGREFLSLQRIKDEWSVWKDLLDAGTFEDKNGRDQGSDPGIGIRNVWWSAQWIPLTYDGGGNHDCLDLNPAEGGNWGQIITMWHDDGERKIIAPSFRAWLEHFAEGLESGQYLFSEEYNGIVNADDI